MTPPTASVVIVSRDRADLLKRCLMGVSQLQYPRFEVIVVADPKGIAAAEAMPFASTLKLVPFDIPNISAARNLGIAEAAGEFVAFIDDDAVPEPMWLHYLMAPAEDTEVAAMGGFVRGRNGISWQWTARKLDRFGVAHPIEANGEEPSIHGSDAGFVIKTEGTNMAVRRSVLRELGGFDPAYQYYLDETDLNMRIAASGLRTVIVPLAQVHHSFAANAMRGLSRVPTDLFEIGASWAVFQRKHVPLKDRENHWHARRADERNRLLRHLVAGLLEPRQIRHLLSRLDEGYKAGQEREIAPVSWPEGPDSPFRQFSSATRCSSFVQARTGQLSIAYEEARQRAKDGEIVTVFSFSPSALYHRVWFDPDGFWAQQGGLFGRSERDEPLFKLYRRKTRIAKEIARVAKPRNISHK